MPLNPVLIKDGHEDSAEDFVDLPELEAFLNSNSGEAVRLPNDVDPVSYTHLTLPTTPYV